MNGATNRILQLVEYHSNIYYIKAGQQRTATTTTTNDHIQIFRLKNQT